MKKWAWILIAALLMVSFPAVPASASGTRTAVFMYMCGTDLQSDCVNDLYEMCEADLRGNVDIVVLAGGAGEWDDSRLKAKKLNLFTIEDGDFSSVQDWGKSSMGAADTLEQYVSYAWENYRADRNILIFWNHGGGTGMGVCFDEVHNDDGLTMTEINKALSAVRKSHPDFHLDLLGCDACLMAGYEMAVIASQFADYFVASEELEPWLGWYYTPWLDKLAKEPDMSTAEIGKNIVDAYAKAVKDNGASDYTTLSLIDTSALTVLQSDMELLSSYLEQALENGQLATVNRMVQRMYSMSDYYSKGGGYDMYDLNDLLNLCEQFAPNTAKSARAHLKNAVAYSYASRDMSSACGLSIYIPQTSSEWYTENVLDGYNLSAYIPNYVDFTKGLSSLMNGSDYSFAASKPESADVSTANSSIFSFVSGNSGLIPGSTYNAEESSGSIFAGLFDDDESDEDYDSEDDDEDLIDSIFGILFDDEDEDSDEEYEDDEDESSGSIFDILFGDDEDEDEDEDTDDNEDEDTDSEDEDTSIGSIFNFIFGGSSTDTTEPETSDDDLAFTLQLSADAVNNLSYVEGALFMDVSDDEGTYLVDLGYMRNSWVDWQSGTVYSTFDGKWPTLGDQMVVLYDRNVNDVSRRSLVPVRVNGEDTYLVVVFDAGSQTGRILGHNAGIDDNGMLIRRVTPLQPGDEIIPVYTLYSCTWEELEDDDAEMDETEFDGDVIIWEDGMEIIYESIAEDEPIDYQFAFYLNDIFGDYEMSDFFSFSL